MDWSSNQSRILSGDNTSVQLYNPPLYPYRPTELPHSLLQSNSTNQTFSSWAASDPAPASPTVGVWSRPLFASKWAHSSSHTDDVYNHQTCRLFIDIRIPTSRPAFSHASSLQGLSDEELRLFARQHAFAGYNREVGVTEANSVNLPACVRHHCIDWNFVGKARARPNKWYVEVEPGQEGGRAGKQWRELAFAQHPGGEHYYVERWARREGDLCEGEARGPVVALRAAEGGRDGIIVVLGELFAYILDRKEAVDWEQEGRGCGSTQDLVDEALASGNRALAERVLGIEAGAGRIRDGAWTVTKAVRPWDEGRKLFAERGAEGLLGAPDCVAGGEGGEGGVWLGGRKWNVFESNIGTAALAALLGCGVGQPPPAAKL